MKKLMTLTFAAILSCAIAFAQENGNRDENGNIVRGPYVQNTGFFDNSFIEIQGGVQYFYGQYMKEAGRKYPMKPALALGANFGKWFNPVLGLRLGWQGTRERWFNNTTDYYENYKFNYPHADLLVNVSNWWSGYKETRFWDVIPYLHVGWAFSDRQVPYTTDKANAFGGGVGIYNTFRLSDRWHLTLDLKEIFTSSDLLGPDYMAGVNIAEGQADKMCYIPSAMLGISFTMGKTGWKRQSTVDYVADFTCVPDQAAKDEQAVVLAAQDKAEAAVKGYTVPEITTEEELAAAIAALTAVCAECDNAVETAQALVDKTSKKVDANGNVLPACYAVDEATAQRYCEIANNEGTVDFTAMTNKEIRQWTKAHKDIVPEGWNKMSAIEKNVWYNSTIICPATLAKEQAAFAEAELEKAKARKVSADLSLDNVKKIVIAPVITKPEGLEAIGYFTIGRAKFNTKQMNEWKESIEVLGKEFDYEITGYTDKETGSSELNAKLRKDRSEYIKGLMEEEGFTGELTTKVANEDDRLVKTPSWKNRAAVIK